MDRNPKGQFFNGAKNETLEERQKRVLSFKKSWRERETYIGDIKGHKLFNIYRSFMFTKKGQLIGHDERWNKYRDFYNDVLPIYEENKRFVRINKKLPFSLENCTFLTDEESGNFKSNTIILEYNNESKSLKEWAFSLNRSLTGIRSRYYSKKKYTTEEILFGKQHVYKKRGVYTKENIRASKLCSSAKIKDRKKGLENNIDMYWFMENISNKPCIYCEDTVNTGMDRVDNSKGHTKDNVVPCCMVCNTARNSYFTVNEMKKIGKVIKEIKSKR